MSLAALRVIFDKCLASNPRDGERYCDTEVRPESG